METFPLARRPLEYVAVIRITLLTREGPGHFFFACDAYSQFAFNLGVEKDDCPETVLKVIYFLLENPDFEKKSGHGFTLVFAEFEDLSARIHQVIAPAKGKLIFDKAFNEHISKELMEGMARVLLRK